jgi:hypothetical protein
MFCMRSSRSWESMIGGKRFLKEKIEKYVRDSNQHVEDVCDWVKKYSKILKDNIRDDKNKFNSNWCMELGNCYAS